MVLKGVDKTRAKMKGLQWTKGIVMRLWRLHQTKIPHDQGDNISFCRSAS